jgi:hypothetical protein
MASEQRSQTRTRNPLKVVVREPSDLPPYQDTDGGASRAIQEPQIGEILRNLKVSDVQIYVLITHRKDVKIPVG